FELDDAIVLLLGSDPGKAERRGEIKGITRLEKLIFLLERESNIAEILTEDSNYYAHNYGPFSQKVYQAIDILTAAGLVEDSTQASANSEDQMEYSRIAGPDAAPSPYSTRDFRLTINGRNYYKALVSDIPKSASMDAGRIR
ncbi:SocA family protein, partial [Brevibacterium casei]|uniref:SocA family protein n=1 Tax=Brevibacterium casei TaxID=33889 RepID=UPI001C92D655